MADPRRKILEDKTKGKKTYSPTKRERATNTYASDQEKARKKLEEFDERASRRGVSAPYGSN